MPAVIWAIILAFLSLSAHSLVPHLNWKLIGPDKVAHALSYAVFGALTLRGFRKLRDPYRYAGLVTIMVCSGFGALMEVFQAWMRLGRQFDYHDMAANAIGVFIAYCIFKFILKAKNHGS